MEVDTPTSTARRDRLLDDSSLSHLDDLVSVCADLRATLAAAIAARKANPPNIPFQSTPHLSAALAPLFRVRALYRTTLAHTRELRREAQERKGEVDAKVLELRNVEYERANLRREIALCEEMETVYQTIELVDMEAFMNAAPPPMTAETDPHKITLNRLEFEKSERMRLTKAQAELEQKKQKLTEEILRKQQELDKLDETLENYLKGSADLAATLDVKVDPEGVSEAVRNLPKPLYVLYRHLKGYQQSLGPNALFNVDLRPSVPPPRPKPSKDSKESFDEELLSLYSRHATEVVMAIRDSSASALANFAYLPRLGFVVVSSRAPPIDKNLKFKDVLTCLWPGDDGTESPVPSTDFLLVNNRPFTFSPEDAGGYAYSWAQHLCGIDFVAPVRQRDTVVAPWIEGEGGRKRPYISRVVEIVRLRLKGLQALHLHLSILSRNTIPDVNFPGKVPTTSKLISWRERELVDSDKAHQFNATVQARSTQISFRVLITAEYPLVSPVFEFDLLKDASAMDVDGDADANSAFKRTPPDDSEEASEPATENAQGEATQRSPEDPVVTALRAVEAGVNRPAVELGLPVGDSRLLPVQLNRTLQLLDTHLGS
ncbi:hypothetical protein M427DRAFT_136445 [Gonapodya prolifera JEL478]|uniref:THO complex subunit 5 n=1 Tax=Gonapodya prolifera (strain JEL478) TaxID=1344416 RepID=A0A139ABA0_GONPJ|nr:hypothetical protein M427DRAFT_136445 [Gonapodya prolifera JEL478]|eukprot:KXS13673.1 hypothetical protein M427DRAFT_136445 [Gonapodya prolifera JEL478]